MSLSGEKSHSTVEEKEILLPLGQEETGQLFASEDDCQ